MTKITTKNPSLKQLIALGAIVAASVFGGFAVNIWLKVGVTPDKEVVTETKVEIVDNNSMVLSDEQIPAEVEEVNGTTKVDYNIVTVEEVDGGEIDNEDYAQGSYFPTDTWWAFRDATIGRCVIEGNYFGAQCVSLARAFWTNYAGRDFSTCGTGAARGAWNCKEANAGNEFDLVYDPTIIEAGDWIILDGGLYGHVGMAVGSYNNGYVALLGENQGGADCGPGVGGSATNIININLKNFKGAYRPKSYHVAPTPSVPESGFRF